MTNALIFSLMAMLAFGISNATQKIPIGQIGAVKFLTMRGIIISLITISLAVPTFNAASFDLGTVVLGVALAALSYLGIYFFSLALSKSKAGIVIPVASSRMIIIVLMGVIFLGDSISWGKIAWVLPIILGIVLVSLDRKAFQEGNLKQGLIFALLAAFFWGITLPLFGLFSNRLGVYVYAFLVESTLLVISICQTLWKNHRQKINTEQGSLLRQILPSRAQWKQLWPILLLTSATGAIGTITLNAAYGTGFITIAGVLISVAPMISVLIGRFFLKERMNLQQYLGAVIIVASLIGISLTK